MAAFALKVEWLLVIITILSLYYSVCSCGSARMTKKVKRPYYKGKLTRRGKCIDIPSGFDVLCGDFNSNNMTYFPNLFRHTEVIRAFPDLNLIWPLQEAECNPNTKLFLCSVFLPQCPNPNLKRPKMRLPCRSLCEAVRDGCGGIFTRDSGLPWPPPFKCDLFPTGGNCIRGIETPTVAPKGLNPDVIHTIKEEKATNDVHIIFGGGIGQSNLTEEGESEREENTTRVDGAQNEEEKEVLQEPIRVINEVAETNDVYISIGTSDEGHSGNARCKNSNRRVKPEADGERPTKCAKGRNHCKYSTDKSYLNGVLHCCLYNKKLAHTVVIDGDSGQLKSSCHCSYATPSLPDC